MSAQRATRIEVTAPGQIVTTAGATLPVMFGQRSSCAAADHHWQRLPDGTWWHPAFGQVDNIAKIGDEVDVQLGVDG